MGTKTPVKATVDRLEMEGLDRYTALLAITEVLGEQMQEMQTSNAEWSDEDYSKRLAAIKSSEWREGEQT